MSNELLTTDEAADYLRMSERKLYELVAKGAVPCTKVTGRWLFPKPALDRWVSEGLAAGGAAPQAAPAIVGGSHDPLLEWALRQSGSELASLPEGSEAGLRRLARNEVSIAAIHLHRIEGEDEAANVEAVAHHAGLHDAVLIAFVRREQGLVVARGNPLGISNLDSAVAAGARIAQRPQGAGAQLLLVALLARAGLAVEQINLVKPVCATGADLAEAVRTGRADCGIASRSVAVPAALDFVPVLWERFDLVMRRRSYFLPGPQALVAFMRTPMLRERAAELGGYEVADAGAVRQVN